MEYERHLVRGGVAVKGAARRACEFVVAARGKHCVDLVGAERHAHIGRAVRAVEYDRRSARVRVAPSARAGREERMLALAQCVELLLELA